MATWGYIVSVCLVCIILSILCSKRAGGGERLRKVNFKLYKTREIHLRGHYHQIVK